MYILYKFPLISNISCSYRIMISKMYITIFVLSSHKYRYLHMYSSLKQEKNGKLLLYWLSLSGSAIPVVKYQLYRSFNTHLWCIIKFSSSVMGSMQICAIIIELQQLLFCQHHFVQPTYENKTWTSCWHWIMHTLFQLILKW